MPVEIIGILGITLAIILMLGGMRIAYTTFLIGILGFVVLKNWGPASAMAGILPYTQISLWAYFVIPMFILMGYFLAEAGLADEIFFAAEKWVGHLPGGLALTVIFGSAAFAACTGSTAAACAVAGKLLIPKMQQIGYSDRLASGVVAASGTLAMLIPPSFMVVIYAVITEQSVGALLIGGILPGILSAVIYGAMIFTRIKLNPRVGPPSLKAGWKERFASVKGIWVAFFVIAIMLGGLYFGVFSPTEAGAAGAFGILVFIFFRRRLSWKMLKNSLRETAYLTAMILVLMIGTKTLTSFMSLSGATASVLDFIVALEVNRWIVLTVILLLYIVLGMFVGSIAMMVLTLPVVFPMIVTLGFDPIWFGIIVIKMSEIGSITPPIGFNVFVVNSVTNIPLQEIFRGIIPFLVMDILTLVILLAFPAIITFLPSQMGMG